MEHSCRIVLFRQNDNLQLSPILTLWKSIDLGYFPTVLAFLTIKSAKMSNNEQTFCIFAMCVWPLLEV